MKVNQTMINYYRQKKVPSLAGVRPRNERIITVHNCINSRSESSRIRTNTEQHNALNIVAALRRVAIDEKDFLMLLKKQYVTACSGRMKRRESILRNIIWRLQK